MSEPASSSRQRSTLSAEPVADTSPQLTVVIVVERRGRLALFRRSLEVHMNPGRWDCVTVPCLPGARPLTRALECMYEEAGLRASDLSDLREGSVLALRSEDGTRHRVFPVLAVTEQRRLLLSSVHDSYRWTAPKKVARFDGRVLWIDDVIASLTPHFPGS